MTDLLSHSPVEETRPERERLEVGDDPQLLGMSSAAEITTQSTRINTTSASQTNLTHQYHVLKELSPMVFVCSRRVSDHVDDTDNHRPVNTQDNTNREGDTTVVVKLLSISECAVGPSLDHAESAVASKLLTSAPSSRTQPPGIVTYLDLHDQVLFANIPSPLLVMEYCPNGDLFSRRTDQPDNCFTERQALHVFRQVVAGVRHLHSIGFAHLDISLENVLLDANDDAKICDFGLSAPLSESCHGTVGKAQYMAPEVVAGMAYDGVAADVWSLGVVLFIMLTGSPLFVLAVPTDPMWTALRRVGVACVVDRWGLKNRISSGTIALLASMLRVEPSHRPQSLDDVLRMTPTV